MDERVFGIAVYTLEMNAWVYHLMHAGPYLLQPPYTRFLGIRLGMKMQNDKLLCFLN